MTSHSGLTWAQRLDTIDAIEMALDGFYAHLSLKRSLYGVDVLRALERLRQQVPELTDAQFHREMRTVMNRLRDAHTQYWYANPLTKRGVVMSLGFLVEAYGPTSDPVYIVSKVAAKAIADPHFRPGVTINTWNAIDFVMAVDIYAEAQTGGRSDARQARALESLTQRALDYGPKPDEQWVELGYTDLGNKQRKIRLIWKAIRPGRADAASAGASSRRRLAINPAAEAVRRAKKSQFNAALARAEKRAASLTGRLNTAASRLERYADFVSAKTVSGQFGLLRLWSFDVNDENEFVQVVRDLIKNLPQRGLIIDLRDNPGGVIVAAESLLQLFTPHAVVPTRFGLRSTSMATRVAQAPGNRDDLGWWAESLITAQQTGEPYSAHLPITPLESCNAIGQCYGGPIVVIVNANTYSSGDLFTAGIVDNRIGPVVCIGQASGAGGANVWDDTLLRSALRTSGQSMPPLPPGVSFSFAVRRAVRAGDAQGTLIEDSGVSGQSYAMTKKDILKGNVDLMAHCASVLLEQPYTQLSAKLLRSELVVRTEALERIDVFVEGHPIGPSLACQDGTKLVVKIPRGATRIEVLGYAGGELKQRRVIPVDQV